MGVKIRSPHKLKAVAVVCNLFEIRVLAHAENPLLSDPGRGDVAKGKGLGSALAIISINEWLTRGWMAVLRVSSPALNIPCIIYLHTLESVCTSRFTTQTNPIRLLWHSPQDDDYEDSDDGTQQVQYQQNYTLSAPPQSTSIIRLIAGLYPQPTWMVLIYVFEVVKWMNIRPHYHYHPVYHGLD